MSRAFIAYYYGDHLKKTQHLDTLQQGALHLLLCHCWEHGSIPLESASRANIARMTPPAWKKIAPVIDKFFDAEGRNKRAAEEIEKSDRIRLKRSIAGGEGGRRSGISKSITRGQQLRSNEQAIATELLKQPRKQKGGNSVPIQNSNLDSSSVAARELAEKAELSGGSLATAHPEGALREPLSGETNRLVEALDRLKAAKAAESAVASIDGKVWIDEGTIEWSAHQHYAQFRKIRSRLPIEITTDGVTKRGAYFDSAMPPGYDPATGERIEPAKSEENA